MISFRQALLIVAISWAATAAPASAVVLLTAPVYGEGAATGTYHACVALNTSTTPLSATSKMELVDWTGIVTNSASLAGLAPGTVSEITDSTSGFFMTCRFTAASAKKIKGMIVVYYYDGSKYQTLIQDEAR